MARGETEQGRSLGEHAAEPAAGADSRGSRAASGSPARGTAARRWAEPTCRPRGVRMALLKYAKPVRLSLKDHPEFNERWLQPTVTGKSLGDGAPPVAERRAKRQPLTPAILHEHLKQSLAIVRPQFEGGLRLLLEAGSAERLFTDLLFLTLWSAGHKVSREFPLGGRLAADLVVHGKTDIVVEAKQLHLMDGCRHIGNVRRDLDRHAGKPSLGVIYLLDETRSEARHPVPRFGGANRRAKHTPDDILEGLRKAFRRVVPSSSSKALLRSFVDCGHLDVYAFVVAEPRATQAT
jgi:hypothetical protein